MDFLKGLFENGALDFEAFSKALTDKGIKLADLSKGDYVSKLKYEDDLGAKDSQINDLTGQINQRNTDLQTLQEQLKNVQGDESKVNELNAQLSKMQEDYNKSKDKYEKQIASQQYEFAVKEFANEQKFTSAAAKRDFIRSMVDKKLQMENGKLVGATDYLESYKTDNADSFTVVTQEPKPTFVDTTTKKQPEEKVNPFLEAMNFTGVRTEIKK